MKIPDDFNKEDFDVGDMRLANFDPKDVKLLAQYWELRDIGDMLSWSLQMLAFLTRAEQAGWHFMLVKGERQVTPGEMGSFKSDEDFYPFIPGLDGLKPVDKPDGVYFKRLDIDAIAKKLKKK